MRPTIARLSARRCHAATELWKRVDVNVIDGAVNGVARAIAWGGWLLRLTQSGQAQHYALGMALGAVVLVDDVLILVKECQWSAVIGSRRIEHLSSCR